MIRDVLDQIKTEIDKNLATHLVKQDEKYDDPATAVSKESVETILGDREHISAIQSFPAVMVLPNEPTIVEYSSNKKDFMHDIIMAVLIVDNVPLNGQKRVYSFLRSLENVFESQITSWPLGVIFQYQTVSYIYDAIGTFATEKGDTVYTGAIRAMFKERENSYLSTQV